MRITSSCIFFYSIGHDVRQADVKQFTSARLTAWPSSMRKTLQRANGLPNFDSCGARDWDWSL
jgi:hypothetical protein